MRKVDQNKKQKKDSLLDACIRDSSWRMVFTKLLISDIVNQAGVAKGTFSPLFYR